MLGCSYLRSFCKPRAVREHVVSVFSEFFVCVNLSMSVLKFFSSCHNLCNRYMFIMTGTMLRDFYKPGACSRQLGNTVSGNCFCVWICKRVLVFSLLCECIVH